MREIPFLRHLPPIPLPSSSSSSARVGGSARSGGPVRAPPPRRIVASLVANGDDDDDDDDDDAVVAVILAEQRPRTTTFAGAFGNNAATTTSTTTTTSTALVVPIDAAAADDDDDYRRFDSGDSTDEESPGGGAATPPPPLRGLSSAHLSKRDNRVVLTSGVAGECGCVVRISVRDAGGGSVSGSRGTDDGATMMMADDNEGEIERDLEVDLSPLMRVARGGTAPFEHPVAGIACFVTPEEPSADDDDDGEEEEEAMADAAPRRSWRLVLRAVDPHGTVLSLSFSYPDLTPLPARGSSFLLPLSPGSSPGLRPHPGSLIEGANQVCFPTPSTVMFALSPHLYCVDFGGNGDGGAAAAMAMPITRVWTSVHRSAPDPIADPSTTGGAGGGATPSTRKRPRKSLGGVLAGAAYIMMGIGDSDGDGGYEYDDHDDEGGGNAGYGGSIPPVAALADLPSLDDDSHGDDGIVAVIARAATLHSDGSLRVWTAEPSLRESSRGRLRIPSVQRVAVASATSGWTSSMSETMCEDPPLPHTSAWDPRGDAITLRGRSESESGSYEVAVHVRCHASGYSRRDRDEGGGGGSLLLHVFRGYIIPGGALDDGPPAPAVSRSLALPPGTRAVEDLSWAGRGGGEEDGLVALLKCGDPDADGRDAFYRSQEDDGALGMALAMYPLDKRKGTYSNDPAVLDLDRPAMFSSSVLTADEELGRYLRNPALGDDDDGPEGAVAIAEAEARIDRAGLQALLQPFGRPRPPALAVHRAMSGLGLLEGGDAASPADFIVRASRIVSAMRGWRGRGTALRPLGGGGALVPAVEGDEDDRGNGSPAAAAASSSPGAAPSVYDAFASAAAAARGTSSSAGRRGPPRGPDGREKGGSDALRSHSARWARLLSEVRRHEARLDGALRLVALPGGSAAAPGANLLVLRGSAVSVLEFVDGRPSPPARRGGGGRTIAAGLDDMAGALMERVASDAYLRGLLCDVESALYEASSRAAPLVEGWSEGGHGDIELLSRLDLLARKAMAGAEWSAAQVSLLDELRRQNSDVAEAWLSLRGMAPFSASGPSAKVRGTAAASDGSAGRRLGDAVSTATTLVSSQLESARILSLSRLLLAFGTTRGDATHARLLALRHVLYCAGLSWAINQQSSVGEGLTVLEECLSREAAVWDYRSCSALTAAAPLAGLFVSAAFSNDADSSSLLNLIPPSREPRIALRLLAPLIEFPVGRPSSDAIHQNVAECLLAEATAIAKRAKGGSVEGTPPDVLWRLASRMLLESPESSGDASGSYGKLIHRVTTLERHLMQMDGSFLPLCSGVVLEAIQDALSQETTIVDEVQVSALWLIAYRIAMRGHLWDEALHACISNPTADQKEPNLRNLILGMVDAGALGKIVAMSLTVVSSDLSTLVPNDGRGVDGADGVYGNGAAAEVDLFDMAARIIEEAAVDHASSSSHGRRCIVDGPNYWGCLYTLHASRGNWRQAAYAMDMCGKATANSVSSLPRASNSQKQPALPKAVSKKIMDNACLSAHACFHALSLVDRESHRYLLPGGHQADDSPSASRLLKEEDLERRSTRAVALRTLAMDEYSPDSVGTILESDSRDTIDLLARLGYYDHAIAIALGCSSKRQGLPGGVDLFDDALKYILCAYLIPAATQPRLAKDGAGIESLQSRSKVAQIRTSSSVCALSAHAPGNYHISSSSVNPRSGKALHSTMAMDLLQQYTTLYSERCSGLALSVADAILQAGGGMSNLPLWLKELCMSGIPGDVQSENGLFAQSVGKGVADPAALMRLFIKHHQYGEACDVVTSILSKEAARSNNVSSRLPEKGCVDYVPYGLIDMLWEIIESIISSNTSNPSEKVKSQVKSLINRRTRMEKSLEKHFEMLKISEEGLKSARSLFRA